jgi:aldehyde dehydrogenase (NAD+)
MSALTDEFAAAISPALARSPADTLAAELLPLLDACRFLERNAARLLRPRKLGRTGRPLWFYGVVAEVHREPLGHVLIIGPSNFPLLLAGVQTLQALVAGNTVTWKPGTGGAPVAELFARCLQQAGLPAGVLTITADTLEASQHALAQGPDKVIFTGSSRSGTDILATLAKTATPAVLELSGADAIIVTPGADLAKVARAVAFGLRLNGGAVCMSPRRLFATPATMAALRCILRTTLADIPPVALDASTASRLRDMLDEATNAGAEIHGQFDPAAQRPLVVNRAVPGMAIASSDIFAPVISLIEAETMLHVPEMVARCAYGLTIAVFCAPAEERRVRSVLHLLKAGTVLINDVIAPTVDPRVPFGGRGASGYGVTRGAEGLLEMTAVKTLLVRRGGSLMHLDATTAADVPLFAGLIGLFHGKGFGPRFMALRRLIQAARHRKL